MPNQPILFSLKESRTLTRQVWHQFTTAARENGHSLAGIFRAFVLAYIEQALGPAAKHYAPGPGNGDERGTGR